MRTLAAILAVMGAASVATAQDDPLKTARDLYASAAYVEALAELARVKSAPSPTPTTSRDTDTYRTFCLVALGRDTEAQAVAESLVRRDPTFSLEQLPDVSPRIAAMFASVRKRVLPLLIKDEYRIARTRAVDHEPDAESRLLKVRQLLDVAERIGVLDDTLKDVRLIVDGFLELVDAAQPRHATDEAAPAATPALPPAGPVSTSADVDVVAPTPVFQPQPTIPPALLTLVRQLRRSGAIDVAINEQGTVDDVTVRQSLAPVYDRLIVAAARTWRYKPALKNGVPIKYVSTVVINVSSE